MLKKFVLIMLVILRYHTVFADDKAFLATVYTTVTTKHFTPVSAEEFAISGLKTLNNIDKNMTFADGRDMVYLYYKRQQAGLWHKPESADDAKQWAIISDKVIEKAVKVSYQAAKNKDKIAEKVVFSAVAALDDNSRYFFADEADKEPESEQLSIRHENNILYVELRAFAPKTPTMLKNAFNRYPDAVAAILDLRGNHGGQLNAAIEIAKMFIDDGIIVSTNEHNLDSAKFYISRSTQTIKLPLAILIDKDTASSAEMLAIALQEQVQATLIGTLSYGKGTIQDTYIFDNGGRLALTTAKFFSPSGAEIEKRGITPDYCILNDSTVKPENCIQQKRVGREFDIIFAKQILNRQLGRQN